MMMTANEGQTGTKELSRFLNMEVMPVAYQCSLNYDKYNECEQAIAGYQEAATESKKYLILLIPSIVFSVIAFSANGAVIGLLCLAGVAGSLFMKARNEKRQKEAAEQIEGIQQEQVKLLDDINKIYAESGLAGRYPQNYLYVDAVQTCISFLDDMRADTLKEALNLYEQTLHNKQMLDAQQRIREATEQAEHAAKATQKAAIFAAVMSGVTAVNTNKIRKSLE